MRQAAVVTPFDPLSPASGGGALDGVRHAKEKFDRALDEYQLAIKSLEEAVEEFGVAVGAYMSRRRREWPIHAPDRGGTDAICLSHLSGVPVDLQV